jgi:cobaltochelatase CobT
MLWQGAGLSPEESFKRATLAALRALSGRPAVEVVFGGPADDAICLPAVDALDERNVARVRGAADSAALRLLHHDARLHARERPPGRKAAEAYDAMEQARVEILGARRYAGVAANIAAALQILGGAVPELQMLVHSRAGTVGARPVTEPLGELLDRLVRHAREQAAFSRISLEVIRALHLDRAVDEEAAAEARGPGKALRLEAAGAGAPAGDAAERRAALPGKTEPGAGSGSLESAPAPKSDRPYRVFTDKYDRVVHARDLCTPEERARLRAVLDGKLKDFRPLVVRLANRLRRILMADERRSWNHDRDEGVLDSSRLTRLVTSRSHPLAFKQPREDRFRDSAVCLLFDNSGSMQGRPITVAAMTAEVLAHTLERCGVAVEILGFTTADWKGGEARRHWERAGMPKDPGRLNDLRHIVYKPAATPWKRARQHLGAMISPDVLRENVDGEALGWAHRRLRRRHERRKILVVVSDGAPADESTLSLNPRDYLDRHLHETVARLERVRDVELVAIGLGHDVNHYYRRAVTIDSVEALGGTMLREITLLFDSHA